MSRHGGSQSQIMPQQQQQEQQVQRPTTYIPWCIVTAGLFAIRFMTACVSSLPWSLETLNPGQVIVIESRLVRQKELEPSPRPDSLSSGRWSLLRSKKSSHLQIQKDVFAPASPPSFLDSPSVFILQNDQMEQNLAANDDNNDASIIRESPTKQPPQQQPQYTAFQDVSWAIRDTKLATPQKQAEYDAFMQACVDSSPPSSKTTATTKTPEQQGHHHRQKHFCYETERERLIRNIEQPPSMKNYTRVGFQKIRAPPELFQLVQDFWKANRDKAVPELDRSSPYHNSWVSPPTLVNILDKELPGGGHPLGAAISSAAKSALEGWTGQKLAQASLYGIRVYHNQSILAPHVDRTPLISSAILNVDQNVDEDWPLEVYDHDGVAHNITMKPGEMVLYESHSIVHGRPFALKGKFFANIFIHFEPLGEMASVQEVPRHYPPPETSRPPWLVPGSAWERRFLEEAYPQGWSFLQDIHGIINRGDLDTLKYVVQRDPTVLTRFLDEESSNWQPLHYAVELGHLEMVRYMLEEGHGGRVDVNALYTMFREEDEEQPDEGPPLVVMTPLDIYRHFGTPVTATARASHEHQPQQDEQLQHPDADADAMIQLLRKHGGKYQDELS